MLKNCLSLPKLLYFLRTRTCFNHPALLEKYDKTVRDGLSKECNVKFDNISSTQLALPAEMGGLGVSFASLLALSAFLALAFGASDFLTTFFSETFEDVSFTEALQKWLNLPEKYIPLSFPREFSTGGGILLIHRKDISISVIQNLCNQDFEIDTCRVLSLNYPIIFICCYRPPSGNLQLFLEEFHE